MKAGRIIDMQKSGFSDPDTLPELPVSFWHMCASILKAWKSMTSLLSEEWTALKDRDLEKLSGISEKKCGLCKLLENMESRLGHAVDSILHKYGLETGPDRWENLRLITSTSDISRLENWMAECRKLREEALSVNIRHRNWLEDQYQLSRELMAILCNRKTAGRTVYGPEGRLT